MPTHDPIDNIMSTLRHQGGIDPNTAAHRKASMKQQRQGMGVPTSVGATRGKPKGQAGRQQQRPAPGRMEEGPEGEVQIDERDFTPIIIDQMNETIISLKVQISRENNPERRRQLEQQAGKLREQITSLGGDPIRADESVEDGLQKLKQYGYIGWDSLQMELYGHGTAPSQEGHTATFDPGYHFSDDRPRFTDRGDPPPEPAPAPTGTTGTGTRTSSYKPPAPATAIPDYYGEHLGEQTRPFDELTSILDQIGSERAVEGAPELQVNSEYVNNLLEQMGLTPRSEEEIAAHAQAIVERQVWERSQIIERELERFDREFPEEFARAEKQIQEYAANLSAERQEEFTARGMFYSSVMAGSLSEIDDKSMELIGDIARDAANHVTELRADLRDIAEWGILEQEVVRRELEAVDRAERERLFNIHLEVAMRADQYALDTWYKEQQLNLAERAQVLSELQFRVEEMERMGMHMALSQMADHPIAQEGLRNMGITPQQFAAMPMEQRSNLVQSIVHYEQVEQQMRMNEVQMQAILADISIREQQLALQRAQIAESRRQFDAQMDATLGELGADPTLDPATGAAQAYQNIDLAQQHIQANNADQARTYMTRAEAQLNYLPDGDPMKADLQRQVRNISSQISALDTPEPTRPNFWDRITGGTGPEDPDAWLRGLDDRFKSL